MTRTRRGFSLVELVAAAAVFLVVGSVLTVVVARSIGAAASAQLRNAVDADMTAALAEVAGTDFDDLVAVTFTPPSACPDSDVGTLESCFTVAARTIRAAWTVDKIFPAAGDGDGAGVDGVTVTVTAKLSDGSVLSRAQRVNAPAPDYLAGSGTVRVAVVGDTAAFGGTVHVVDAADPAVLVATGVVGTGDGIADVRIPAGSCTAQAPCRAGIGVGSTFARNGGHAVAAADIVGVGANIVVDGTAPAETTITLFATGTANVHVTATNANGDTGSPQEPGSVCLWARFDDGVAVRDVPFCNTDDPATLRLTSYTVDGFDLAVPAGTPIAVTVDSPDGTCPALPGAVGHSSDNSWEPAAVCTSYTWGLPSTLAGADSTGPLPGTTLTVDAGTVTDWTVDFSGPEAGPAAGTTENHAQALWSKPRDTPPCAYDATCTSHATLPPPENETCPGQHCYSSANGAPSLHVPSTDNGTGARWVDRDPLVAGTSTTTFSVAVSDPDGDPITMILAEGPAVGQLRADTDTSPAVYDTPGTTIAAALNGPTTVNFRYEQAGSTRTSFVVELHDGINPPATYRVVLAMDGTEPVLLTSLDSPTVAQGRNVQARVKVTAGNGTGAAGVTVHAPAAPDGMTVTPGSATTDADGIATFTITATTHAAGPVTLSGFEAPAVPGSSVDVTVHVTSAPGDLFVTVGDPGLPQGEPALVEQGGTAEIEVLAVDRAGHGMADVVVHLRADDGSALSDTVYPAVAGCVTDEVGACSTTLTVEPGAKAGQYSVSAASGGYTAVDPVDVTPVPHSIDAGTLTVGQGDTWVVTGTVLDGAGDPVTPISVAVVGYGAQVQNTDGPDVTVTGTVAMTEPVGPGTLDWAVNGLPVGSTAVKIAPTASSLTGPASVTVNAGGTANVDIDVLDGTGTVPAHRGTVTFSADPAAVEAGLRYTKTAAADIGGTARGSIAALRTATPGTYALTASLANGTETHIAVTVRSTATNAMSSGNAVQGGTGTVTVTLTNGTGMRAGGKTVTVVSPLAALSVSPAVNQTDSSGAFSFAVTDIGAQTRSGTYNFAVTVDGRTLTVPVLLAPTIGNISVASPPATIERGRSASMTVTLTDSYGNPAVGGTVSRASNDPTVTVSAGPAASNGQMPVTITVDADTAPGTKTVSLSSGGVSAQIVFDVP